MWHSAFFFSFTHCLMVFAEIQPFVLHEFPPNMAHLCPVRAYSDWIKTTKINEGYIFRKLGAGDRPSSDSTIPMVSFLAAARPLEIFIQSSTYLLCNRPPNISSKCSETILLTLVLIQLHTGPTPFAEEDASGCLLIFDGISVRFVNGGDGVLSSHT
jgi:hypothetical protein